MKVIKLRTDIQAIAIDLDHTLLNSQFIISAENAKAIQYASEKSLYIMIATGRMPGELNTYIQDIMPYIDCIISCNGAIVLDTKTSKFIHSQLIPLQSCIELTTQFESDKYNVVFFSGNRVLSRNIIMDPLLEHHVERTGEQIELCADNNVLADLPIHKFLIYDLKVSENYDDSVESPLETKVYYDILQSLPESLRATKTRLGYVECTHQEVSKFNTIEIMLAKQGLSRTHLMTIGDSYNDIDMVKNARIGVAMANAVEEVKQVATMTVSDNDHHGVAEAIQTILG